MDRFNDLTGSRYYRGFQFVELKLEACATDFEKESQIMKCAFFAKEKKYYGSRICFLQLHPWIRIHRIVWAHFITIAA